MKEWLSPFDKGEFGLRVYGAFTPYFLNGKCVVGCCALCCHNWYGTGMCPEFVDENGNVEEYGHGVCKKF